MAPKGRSVRPQPSNVKSPTEELALESDMEANVDSDDANESGVEKQKQSKEDAVQDSSAGVVEAQIVASPEPIHTDEIVEGSVDQLVQAQGPDGQVVEANRPRLMIKKIILENFKSYGGRREIGPFHKSFSSIVGPNGSGKSNTIDALLFVFGHRAKKMRLDKVSQLIHRSSSMQHCKSAKVEVIFQDIIDTGDGANDYEVVEGSELSVVREADKKNQSKYYLDGKTSTFTEVTTLLKKRGVDLTHNRFLILQGEVELISLMKPKAQSEHEEGLLEYLEDIIGSNRLVEPIKEVDEEVEKLTVIRQEKLNYLKVAERARDSLDGPRKEAEQWMKAESEKLELQALLSQSEAKRTHEMLVELEKESKVLESHMEEHRKKMSGFVTQVKAIEEEHNNILKDHNLIKTQMDKAALDFKQCETEDVKFSEDIAFNEQKLEKLKQKQAQEKESAEKFLGDVEQTRRDTPLREKELANLEKVKSKQVQRVDQIMESLKGKAEELRIPKEKKEAELVPLQRKLTEVKKVVEVAQTELTLIQEKTEKTKGEIDHVKQSHADRAQTLKERENELKDIAKFKKERAKLVMDAEERLHAIEKDVESTTQEVTVLRMKKEEAVSSLEQENTRGKLIKAVYEASRSGTLSGVHGRLGDLGTINKKYDVAVSTACGSLDNIVVDTTEDAQAVIQFVRQNELGRTTCICLDKINKLQQEMERHVEAPEGVSTLVDLIQPRKPEYKVAFFFALRRTLVAADMDQATRIGLQGRSRWRVVTLQGGLIDASGTMSGGGQQVAKGGMRASQCMYKPEEVKTLIARYDQENQKLASLRHNRCQMQEALQLTKKEISEFELREKKCEMDISSMKKQLQSLDERLKTLKVPQLSSGEKSKLKELQKLIASRSDEFLKIQTQHHVVEEEVRELHNQIMNIGGVELQEAKDAVDESNKKCEELRRLVKSASLNIENFIKNAKKAEANVKSAREEYAATEKMLANLKEEHSKLDDKAEKVLNSYNKLKEELAEKDTVLVQLRQKRDEVINQANALKSQEVDLVTEMEERTKTTQKARAECTRWGNQLVESRKEYSELPRDIVEDLRMQQEGDGFVNEFSDLARKAMTVDLSETELKGVVRDDLEGRLLVLNQSLQNLKPDLKSIQEFREKCIEHKAKLEDYESSHNQREDARRKLDVLRQQRLLEFLDGFSVISMKLKEMYQMITLGGDAELELVDTMDPFSEGINFSVRPPKKSWKQITNLSGGEKTLASLSLVFALHHYRPTPLYFMDEIDAALDFRNVSIIANYIKQRTKNAQFIVISLRNHMFELADLLVGIYKTHDVSKSVAINPAVFEVKKPMLRNKDTNSDVIAINKRSLQPIEGPPAKRVHRGKENLVGV